MATVRFSKELQVEIIKNAKTVFDKQMKMAQETRPDSLIWANKIYETLFGQHVVALNAVPQEFLHMVDTFDVGRVCDTRLCLRFNFATPKPWPRKFVESDYARPDSGYNCTDISLKEHPAWVELYNEAMAWRDRCAEVVRKREEFVEQVKKIIEAHATLSPALKMWPPLWDLIPLSYKNKHREVVERTKKEITVQIDLSALTAAVVANKITG